MDSYQILVIILSTVLAINLILALVALVIFFGILKQLRKVSDKATEVIDNVETASEFFKNTSMTGAAVKLVSNFSDYFQKHKKRGDK